jgi:hypothetical protein
MEVNGAVNIASNNMANQTALGVTFTVGDDGAITASGTATGNIRIDIGTVWLKKDITYKITATSDLSKSDQYQQLIVRTLDGAWIMTSSNTGGYTPSNDVSAVVTIAIASGQTVSKTFYPMVSVASYTGPYVPHAMTNQELTKKLTSDTNLGTAVDLSTYTAYSNMFTAPSDGYVHVQSGASSSQTRTIYTYGNNTTAAADSHFTHSTSANNKAFEIYVRKGLKIYADGLQSDDTINFYPLL